MNTFVRMTVTEGRARFSKYEIFCCRWEDFKSSMEELLDDDAALESPTTVKFELIQSEKSFEDWCLDEEVVADDY